MSFLGKGSPVTFWWGSFDLAVTRFSGRRAPPHRTGERALAVIRGASVRSGKPFPRAPRGCAGAPAALDTAP